MKRTLVAASVCFLLFCPIDRAVSVEGHDHSKEENKGNIGPEKGILSFSETKGFALSPEALKTFEIDSKEVTGTSPWILPTAVLVVTGDEKNIYRLRDGAFLRVDVQIINKTKDNVTLNSKALRSGDRVVTRGAGFLRVAEVDATSGETGHHH